MMIHIHRLVGQEILDSRGRPTVKATCELKSGVTASASVPSGASTGAAEAHEVRDGDPHRYRGLGCRKAAGYITNEINAALAGQAVASQRDLDETLIALDGTAEKGRLGANTLLAVSLAVARAAAAERNIPLYQYFAEIHGEPVQSLPCLTINLFSGGKHAGGQVAIQDVLIAPMEAGTVDDALATTFAVYQSAAEYCTQRYAMRALTADEGGLAPVFPNAEAMLADAVQAIVLAGFRPGHDVSLAIDVAASHFYANGAYHLDSESLDSLAMIERLQQWVTRYPLISIEDGLAEDDWAHWPLLRERLAGQVLILGDDLLCTNPARILRASKAGAADALLLKVNQIGTLTEAAEACRLARAAGWSVTVSARSGETEDTWLADLAVGWGADFLKIGSITHGERLAKYNRLLSIEAETSLPFSPPPLRA